MTKHIEQTFWRPADECLPPMGWGELAKWNAVGLVAAAALGSSVVGTYVLSEKMHELQGGLANELGSTHVDATPPAPLVPTIDPSYLERPRPTPSPSALPAPSPESRLVKKAERHNAQLLQRRSEYCLNRIAKGHQRC